MSLSIKTKGRPFSIREEQYEGKAVFCLDFNESLNSKLPNGFPEQSALTYTYVINKKMWINILKQMESSKDDIFSFHAVVIEGEVIPYISDEITIGDVTIIGQICTYLSKSQWELDTSCTEISVSPENIPPEIFSLSNNPISKPIEVDLMHKELDGKCQKCGQKCDARTMEILDEGSGITLLCLLCSTNNEIVSFSVAPDLIEIAKPYFNWSYLQAIDTLTQFPKKYALVGFTERTLTYWSWDKDIPIIMVQTDHKGMIHSVTPRNTKQNNIFLKRIDRNVVYSTLTKKFYYKKKKISLPQQDIKIPKPFLIREPDVNKVQRKIDFYKENGEFMTLPLIAKINNRFNLIDGYSTYLASRKLNLSEMKYRIVEKINKKVDES